MGRLQRVGHRRQREWGAYSALVSARSGETAPSQRRRKEWGAHVALDRGGAGGTF